MSSLAQQDNTADIKITNISSHGFWMNIRGREHFMSYEDFPWFKNQTVQAIANVVEFSEGNFLWPSLDVELTQESIELPEPLPLEARVKNKMNQR